ncbi:MAG: hypothetical protein CME62_18325 [Halobacteriovoraceae bacterium]|nr:hypothetical protein [Halobacteriovoraceae bacterium]
MFNLKAMLSLALLVFTLPAFSQNFEGFNKRFELVRDNTDQVTFVKMKLGQQTIDLRPYLSQLKEDVLREIRRMNSKSFSNDMEELVDNLTDGTDLKSDEQAEKVLLVVKSINNLRDVDVEKFFRGVKTKNVLEYFQQELQKAFERYSLFNIAVTDDARYFYKRNVTYEVVKKALDFAKKQFGEVPLLNMASYVIVTVHDMLLEQRLFHQNMLLHYLENTKPQDIGLTVDEADRIFSSIYESRISALNLPESNRAADNWTRYGLNKFYETVRYANNWLRSENGTFDQIGKRYNFAFVEVVENGKRVVKNLVQTKHSFSFQMATAYYVDEPGKVRRFRSLLNLAQFGFSFISLPSWLKNQVNGFVDSYYKEQQLLEGALIGHFEMNGQPSMASQLRSQIINPYMKF